MRCDGMVGSSNKGFRKLFGRFNQPSIEIDSSLQALPSHARDARTRNLSQLNTTHAVVDSNPNEIVKRFLVSNMSNRPYASYSNDQGISHKLHS
ncbi:hypothetical protein M5689_018931 [Euphorbia peplus]|nr:hypothetical protein M5689_018931 [Euphorbia peplus]